MTGIPLSLSGAFFFHFETLILYQGFDTEINNEKKRETEGCTVIQQADIL